MPARLKSVDSLHQHGPGAIESQLIRLIASGEAVSRAELARATGLVRSTVSQYLGRLLHRGLVREEAETSRRSQGRGRPAVELRVAPDAGILLVANLDIASARLAVTDLGQNVLLRTEVHCDLAGGPQNSLAVITEAFDGMLARLGPAAVLAMTIGLPGPVDVGLGRPIRPPIMPGWDAFPVSDSLREHFGCPVIVDNDVNLMALGEARSLPSEGSPLMYVLVDAGIGCGIIAPDGELHHGANGAAGDIGHIRIPTARTVTCRCGNTGCIESVASAAAMAQDLGDRLGTPKEITRQRLTELIRAGDPAAVMLAKEAGSLIGELLAILVHVYNPCRIVLGGPVTAASADLLSSARGSVYGRALPLGTQNLAITASTLGDDAALTGGAVLAVEHVLSPRGIRPLLESAAPSPVRGQGSAGQSS